MTYGEALLFEIGSFLDILLKFICGKNLKDKIYFNEDTLGKLQPNDAFITFLTKCYSQGLSNNPDFSIKKMKEYRNAITHTTILDISKHMMWRAEDGFPTLENNFYILPDNPKDDIGSYTYTRRIAFFGFFEEVGKIFDSIVVEFNKGGLYNKYRIV